MLTPAGKSIISKEDATRYRLLSKSRNADATRGSLLRNSYESP